MMAAKRPGTVGSKSSFCRGLLCILTFVVSLLAGATTAQQSEQCTDFENFQEYWSSWYAMYPTYANRNMYPFGMTFCDSNATVSGKSVGFNPNNDPAYTFKIPFFGSSYHSMWVSPYGFIAFNESTNVQTPPLSYWQPFWPNYNYPHGVDPPFLAPFYASINYMLSSSSQYEPSTISYRVLNPKAATNLAQENIMVGMLAQISMDVRSAVPGTQSFAAQYGLVVTYYDVTYQGISCATGPNLYDTCWRNTFQVALVTDEINTYVVYNYFNITWVGGTDQNCDPSTGLASPSYPNCIPAQIGFNSGFGRGFTSLPYANTSQESNMDSFSGTSVIGSWVYKVSGDAIQHGGCTNDTSLAPTGRWPLTITPLQGPMFGGNVVNVSGPCFLEGMDIKCKFGDQVTNGYYWGNMMQVMCVQPVLYAVGPITLSVSTDGGANYYFAGTYNVIQQERVPDLGVTVINSNNNWLNPTSISLTWNAFNLTSVTSAWGCPVTIQLMGYNATNIWVILYTFETEYRNDGAYTFAYNSSMCYSQNSRQICESYMLGAFRVSLSDGQWDPENRMAVWSSPVPLGWFAQNQAYSSFGESWPQDMCNSWYAQDAQSTQWSTNLPACPCTLDQAYVDFGRFQPSTDCNLNNYDLPTSCPYNQGAIACYESTNVSFYGSSSRCCYNTFGNLLYSGDAVNGSVTARSDPWGSAPYNSNPNIPSISHWTNDLLPYYLCCIWDTNYYDCFNQFMASRPTMDCKNYQPPGLASVFGDPHITTMDNAQYTFNGWGEYWLLYVPNAQVSGGSVSFSLQARFQQPYNMSWGQTHATVMTAIAAKLNSGTTVSVITNLYNEQERMLIYANSTALNFTDPNMNWMQFPEFIVIDNDQTKTYSNFTIIFRIGIGLNVVWQGGLMQLFATIPPEFMRATNGLFGYWNGNPMDDLVPRGGSSSNAVNPNSDMSNIYYSFGQTWIVQQTETIFTYLYRCSMNYFYYKNTWFLPYFTAQFPPNTTVSQSQVTAVCGSDPNCQYDYMVMQDETVAYDTKMNDQWETQMRTMATYVTSCGWLDIPDTIRQMPVSYIVGSQVTIESCMPGFYWYGPHSQTSFTCQSTGYQSAQWSPNTIPFSCMYSSTTPESTTRGTTTQWSSTVTPTAPQPDSTSVRSTTTSVIDLNKCAGCPCNSHETCVPQTDGYSCVSCPAGYRGDNCQFKFRDGSFYPFGRSKKDVEVLHLNDRALISFDFKFFGQVYREFGLQNGWINFDTHDSRLYTLYPRRLPHTLFTSLIVYWTELDLSKGGNIFYRDETNPAVLNDISEDVRSHFPHHCSYSSTGAFILTYHKIPAYGCGSSCSRCGTSCDSVLSFQVILTSDGVDSFAIFHYDRLDYTAGASDCTAHAQIGFNAGDGRRHYTFPSSNTPGIAKFALKRSNVNIPGKWMFSVAEEISGPRV